MTTQICIDTTMGQDCLEFTRIGKGPSKAWRFDSLKSTTKAKATGSPIFKPPVDSAGHGLYYVNLSAHGLMI